MGLWLKLIVAVLATWRITHLLASEDGPADLIVRLRVRLGQGFIGRLMDCFQCLSLWVAAPVTLFLTRRPVEGVFIWLALSGGACLLERFGHEPVVIQPIQQAREGAEESGMLRSETSGFADELHGDN